MWNEFITEYESYLSLKGKRLSSDDKPRVENQSLEDLVLRVVRIKFKVEKAETLQEKQLILKAIITFMKNEFNTLIFYGNEIKKLRDSYCVLTEKETRIFDCARECSSIIVFLSKIRKKIKNRMNLDDEISRTWVLVS